MYKYLFVIVLFLINLEAEDKDYDLLFNNISHSDDNVTKETMRRYIYSDYNIGAYKTNYFIPLSYRLKKEYIDNTNLPHESDQLEAEFQVSFKYEIGADLFGLDEVYSAAYTQKSFWQLYVPSAFFRETNYNPEAFVQFPITIDYKKNGIKAIQLGFAHMSNGRGGNEERSWNYFYSDFFFQISSVFLDLKFWYRVNDNHDYNEELIDYLGHGEVRFMVPYRKHLLEAKFRYSSLASVTTELNYSHPVFLRDDLFFYIKAFNGYGESLIDYNQRVKKIGFGFSISR